MKRIIAKTVNTNVLVVDDNEVNLLIAKTTLQQYGITVTAASSGAEALEKLSAGTFDLIILDCIMPEMSGHETALKMRELKGEGLPIVAYTANNAESVREEFEDIGIIDVLTKPLDTIELTKVMLKTLPDVKIVDKDRTIEELKLLGTEDLAVSQEKTWFEERLSRIPELDYMTGLHYAADNEENYVNVLRAAVESMKTCAMQVASWSEFPGGRPEGDSVAAARVTAHSMKGVCASIGMDRLSKDSAELEKILIAMENGEITADKK